ncbi:MAG: hypothetical protein QM446_02430, partial [Synergistota bacterium]|nr:hypothetical protein [Synergistota bacterium]
LFLNGCLLFIDICQKDHLLIFGHIDQNYYIVLEQTGQFRTKQKEIMFAVHVEEDLGAVRQKKQVPPQFLVAYPVAKGAGGWTSPSEDHPVFSHDEPPVSRGFGRQSGVM